jgi:hypothetical protein
MTNVFITVKTFDTSDSTSIGREGDIIYCHWYSSEYTDNKKPKVGFVRKADYLGIHDYNDMVLNNAPEDVTCYYVTYSEFIELAVLDIDNERSTWIQTAAILNGQIIITYASLLDCVPHYSP